MTQMVIRRVFGGRQSWCALGGFLLCLMGLGHQPAIAQQWDIKQDIDPQHVVGHQACAECHQAEVAAWQKSHHATDAWQLLSKGEAANIAKELGIKDATADRRCTTCHSTQKQAEIIQGVSCESCHGAAGPQDGDGGWFKLHSNFGDGLDPKNKASRDQETNAHYQKRMQDCDAKGMRRSENVYALAKNCLECHAVPSETLVNGGHPTESKGFEFVEWAQGEVRHNFQLDASKNAEAATIWVNAKMAANRTAQGHQRLMYVVGQIADLEVGLRNRASATSRGKFLDAANKRILDAQGNLEDIDKKLKIGALKPVMAALKPVRRSTLRRVNPKDKQTYGTIADAAELAGRKIAASMDGEGWQAVDREIKKGKGPVVKP